MPRAASYHWWTIREINQIRDILIEDWEMSLSRIAKLSRRSRAAVAHAVKHYNLRREANKIAGRVTNPKLKGGAPWGNTNGRGRPRSLLTKEQKRERHRLNCQRYRERNRLQRLRVPGPNPSAGESQTAD